MIPLIVLGGAMRVAKLAKLAKKIDKKLLLMLLIILLVCDKMGFIRQVVPD